MKLIQAFIPLSQQGVPFPKQYFKDIDEKLTKDFGGLTIYSRSPAIGLWKEDNDKTVADDIVIYEVMTDKFTNAYWKEYKKELEVKFKQDVILIRISDISLV